MASLEECREALQTLTGRLGEMNPKDRSSFFSNRSFSCHVTDLGVTFVTTITDQGAEPVKEAAPDEPPADIRLTASSDDVIALAATPANIARMWLAGRVKVQASMRDLLALRRLLLRSRGRSWVRVLRVPITYMLSSHGRADPAQARRDRVEPGR